MSKYFKATAFAVTVIAFNCVSVPVHADGPLDAPPVPSTGGQKGANRRVISSRTRFTAVRGNFSLPSVMKVSSPLSIFSAGLANSKPSFYLGISRQNVTEADAGLQYEWEAIPVYDRATESVKIVPPGWSIFAYARGSGVNYETNPIGGWRAGPGTENANVESFDLAWVVRRNKIRNIAQPGYYAYLEVNAVGATTQPRHQLTQKEEPDFPNRFVPHPKTANYTFATIANTTTEMAAKRVICITQGGSYRKLYNPDGTLFSSVPSKLRFPYPSGINIYDEDGSYMRGVSFRGFGGNSAGQVAFGDPLATQVNPPWENWSNRANNPTNPSVDQTLRVWSGTGFYPDGKDKSISPFTKATGSLPYFVFPSLVDVGESVDSETPARYDKETIDINLRRGVAVGGVQVTPGNKQLIED